MKADHARQFAQPKPMALLIQETFHNSVANYVLAQQGVTRATLPSFIKRGIIHVTRTLLQQSQGKAGILLDPYDDKTLVTARNCPKDYKTLFDILIELKSQNPSDTALSVLAERMQQLPSYQAINPTSLIAAALGLEDADAPASPRFVRVPASPRFMRPAMPEEPIPDFPEDVITTNNIRDRFYNEMVLQTLDALDHGWLSRASFIEQDPVIYFALSELTLLESIQQSQQSNGIRLGNGLVVNVNNSPQEENFPQLVQLLLKAKDNIKSFSPKELLLAKKTICECETDEELEAIKQLDHSFKTSLGVLKQMSLIISEAPMFKAMFTKIMQEIFNIDNRVPADSNATQRLQP